MSLEKSSCKCREERQHCSEESIEEAGALFTLPDKNHPAATMLLDVLESLARKEEKRRAVEVDGNEVIIDRVASRGRF